MTIVEAFLVALLGVEVAVVAQLLLKRAADNEYETTLKQYLNPWVIGGYGLMFVSTLISLVAYRVLPLSYAPIMNAMATISITLLSYFIFKEEFTKRKVMGFVLIVLGILVFLIPS